MADKETVANRLAFVHYEVEPGMKQIYPLIAPGEANPEEPIKLLEVNELTIPTGIMPLGFSASPEDGLDYPTIIVEITPEEFTKIQRQELRLPRGWRLGPLMPRTSNGNGSNP